MNDEFEYFRYKVALIEKEFVAKNKEKYADYCDLERALNKKLNDLLGEEKKELVAKVKEGV